MKKDSKIYVAGHTGLVGSAIVRELQRRGYANLVGYRVDLSSRSQVWDLFMKELPEYVFGAAAHAGGIMEAINKPAEMLIDNLFIQANLTDACKEFGVKKFLNIGSSCIYPVDGKQPYTEEQLGTGKTDENWSYAVAKLAGIELCRAYHKQYGCNFMSVIPCNLYGINDNFDYNGHVIPMLIRRFHERDYPKALIKIWGDGGARREFLYVDDFAKAAIMLMEKYNYSDLYDGAVNVGWTWDISIEQLVSSMKYWLGFVSDYTFDTFKPLGVHSKLIDSSRIHKLGWTPTTGLKRGLEKTYDYYRTLGEPCKIRPG